MGCLFDTELRGCHQLNMYLDSEGDNPSPEVEASVVVLISLGF